MARPKKDATKVVAQVDVSKEVVQDATQELLKKFGEEPADPTPTLRLGWAEELSSALRAATPQLGFQHQTKQQLL